VLDLYSDRIEAQSVQVVRDWRRDVSVVWADQEALYRALVNLAANALDAMPRGGVLTLRVGWSDGDTLMAARSGSRRVAIEIEDSGIGIEPANLDRVFNPFFSTKEGGTGLGLALTQKIVEDHGGSIDVRSTPGVGTSFRIVLPLMPDPTSETGHDDRLG
jgi:signal transduction histidine kinase